MDTNAAIEHRLELLMGKFGWTPERVSGFRLGLADQRAGRDKDVSRLLDRDGDASFDDAECPPAERVCLGYLDGWNAGLILDRDVTDYSDELTMMQEVEAWSGNRDKDFDIDAATWTHSAASPIEPFLSIMSREAWVDWLVEEDRAAKEEGRYGYADLIVQEIRDAIVYVTYEDGKVDVWDGWHRIAATIAKGETHLPTIQGVPAPEPAPSP